MALRTVGVRLTAEVADYQRNLRMAGQSTKDFVGEMDKAAKTGHLDAVADQAMGLGVAGVAAFGLVVKSAADFDKAMSKVRAATHASASDINQLREAALQAGKDTSYSATQAADAITELSKAGVSTADVLGGGLKGALDLAAAGQMDVGEAAETAASALTQFKLKGKDVPHVADLLAAAAGKAQGSVSDMGYALKQSGLVASDFGLSIEDTTGTLAAFASAGLIGSDAGTSFKSMIQSLQNPTKESAAKLRDLGISVYDAQGRFVGITNLAEQLRVKMGGLTQATRDQAMAQIFGSDGIRAASILYRQGASGIQGWIDKTHDAEYAARSARIQTDNLAGDLERLKGSLETLAIESGSGANSGLRTLTQAANALVNQFASLPSGVASTITVLAGLGGALLLGGAAWAKYRRSTAEALEELRATGPAGEKAAVGLDKARKGAARAGLAFAGLQIAGAAVDSAVGGLNPQLDALAVGLAKFATSGEVSGEVARLLGDDMGKLDQAFYDLADTGRWSSFVRFSEGFLEGIIPGLDKLDLSLSNSTTRLSALDGALQQLVQGGHADQAAQIFQKLAERQKAQGISLDELKKALPGYAATLETAGQAAKKTSGDVNALGGSASEAAKDIEEMNKALEDLFSQQMSADRAAIKLAQSTVELREELTKGSRTLSVNTEEGRKNRSSVLDQLEAIEDLRSARVKHGMALDVANKKYLKDVDGLKAIMRQAGFSERSINELVGAYRKIPKSVNTKVSTTDVPQVKSKLDQLVIYQRALAQGISVTEAKRRHVKLIDRLERFAGGGPIKGPGTATSDSIPALLSNGEHVWTAAEVAKLGGQHAMLNLRSAVRSGKRVDFGDEAPGFAQGGPVVWPFPVTAKGTRIPSRAAVASAVVPEVPSGGRTSDWIVQVARMLVPGIRVLSKDRPGATTLSGNRSYHSMGRAVDFEPSRRLAELWNDRYKSRTKELISPWNSLNIHNGSRHTYTGAVYRQHNFAGGNAHDHIAMKAGGMITEPILGVGASGRSYSFGENYQPERVVPNWQPSGGGGGNTTNVYLTAQLAAGANIREAGRQLAEQLGAYLEGGGTVMLRSGAQVLP